jgi:hypothetical protein
MFYYTAKDFEMAPRGTPPELDATSRNHIMHFTSLVCEQESTTSEEKWVELNTWMPPLPEPASVRLV